VRPFRHYSIVLILTALSSAAAAEGSCAPDKYTTVCSNSAGELRVIKDTASPSGKYGVVWQVPADTSADVRDDGSKSIDGDADNFIIRLSDGKIIAKLDTDHFGDHARYNFNEITAVWSPDSRFVAVLHQTKWSTDVADVYFMPPQGAAPKPVDLMPVCRTLGRDQEATLRRKTGNGYEHTADVKAIANDGVLSLKCAMQVRKEDDYFGFAIRIKLNVRKNALAARLIDARLCADDNGPCAMRTPHP